MEFRVHRNLRSQIKEERRDIALISAPGMGLTTLLRSLAEVDGLPVTWLDVNTIMQLWDTEYCGRTKNRRYVIHAAVIRALSKAKRVCAVSDEVLFRTSLPSFLGDVSSGFDSRREAMIVIDEFDALPKDLALLICKELKSIADQQHQALRALRFIVGGAVDFNDLFAGELLSGGSPATNFLKYRPYQFLLTPPESVALLETSFPRVTQLHPSVMKFVIDWCGGYMHYLMEFAKWILEQAHEISNVTPHSLMAALQNCIADQDRMSLFKYCDAAWSSIAEETTFLSLLTVSTSAGYVHEQGGIGRRLAKSGLLIEKPGTSNVFYLPNRLVELYIRQRLAEKGRVLPIAESALWVVPSLNVHAYQLFAEIENRLRNYIADKLFSHYKSGWIENGFKHVVGADGSALYDKTTARYEQEQRSIYATPDIIDPLLTALDFPDLGSIVTNNTSVFSADFIARLPIFLDELNYHRRRIAHSRPITPGQIDALEGRWRILQTMMAQSY